ARGIVRAVGEVTVCPKPGRLRVRRVSGDRRWCPEQSNTSQAHETQTTPSRHGRSVELAANSRLTIRLDEAVADPADVFSEQRAAKLGERRGGQVVEGAQDRLALVDLEGEDTGATPERRFEAPDEGGVVD